MLKTLRDLFEALKPVVANTDPQAEQHALRLATAVMLVEVMRAEAGWHPDAHAAVVAALREDFDLDADEADRLTELAQTTAAHASDLFSFTSRINDHFDMPHKLRMIEQMWRVAYADGCLGDYERHVMWRVADLLHIPQGAYALARIRARDVAGAG